ncbi:MAG: VRR-NUC domain-containing protein [Candidatus Omnitrophica bacterium]|nr:VRR-NUC domain-containing protein [Candidatus Omnitrophota bacterium]
MTETSLKNNVLKMIRDEFPDIWFYKTHDLCTSGIPDILMCQDGHLCAVELKRPGYDYTKSKGWKLQKHIIDRINACGGKATVCTSVDEVRKFLKKEVRRNG